MIYHRDPGDEHEEREIIDGARLANFMGMLQTTLWKCGIIFGSLDEFEYYTKA